MKNMKKRQFLPLIRFQFRVLFQELGFFSYFHLLKFLKMKPPVQYIASKKPQSLSVLGKQSVIRSCVI